MPDRGIVLGFYQDNTVANAVLKELRRQRYHCSASIHHAEDGRITVKRCLHLPAFGPRGDLIARYRRWVVRNETLIIVQTRPRNMARVLELLHHVSSSSPATFILLPDPAVVLPQEQEFHNEPPVTLESLRLEAGRLASTHRVSPERRRRLPLTGHLLDSESTLKYVQDALSTAVRVGQPVSMSAEWLLDNAYILQGHIDDFRRNLPTRFYEELPLIADGSLAGLPRVYAIATKLISDTDTRLDSERIHEFLRAYQDVSPLTMGELWALPLMLRLRIIECVGRLALRVELREREREQADFLAHRLLTAARQDRERLLPFVTELAREHPKPSSHLAEQLVSYLYDEESALSALMGWLEYSMGAPLVTATQQEHLNQTTELVALANAITTLRQFAQFDWRELFETLSDVEAILRTDPAGIYARMDFATRDQYRHVVEEMARRSRFTEREVAAAARDMASAGTDPLTQHIGYYLKDQGRELLEAQIGCHPRLSERARRWTRSHAEGVYLSSVSLITAGVVIAVLVVTARAGVGGILLAFLGLLALLPSSEVGVQVVNYLVTRLIPPEFLPRMAFEEGIPEEYRTLVVVPMLLLTPESIRENLEHLEVRYLANPDPNLRFGLLSDFPDSPQKDMPDDVERLDVVVQGIEQLNARYGSDRFFLFHREGQWSESEGRWIGWERKRGKLEDLNRFLMEENVPEQDSLLRVGDAANLRGIRFVITLDADTQLPRDTARRMVETLAHILNRPHISQDGRMVERGYTIIQPSVATSLPSATATRFSRIFTDATGIDPYTHVSSDVYQDLAGESSYQGKGIYDLQAFHHVLSARFPEAHLLSHDLLEGAHVRVGLASDIELLDQFPGDYLAYAKRRHRWIRGDWQIMDWLLPRVPTADGGRVPNPLTHFNRWKIADNLRRSLLPAASIALLAFGWLFSPVPAAVSLLIGTVLLMPALTMFATRLTIRSEKGLGVWRQLGTSLLQAAIFASLLPEQAFSALDAIGRVCYRRLVSHQLMLEWQTAQETQNAGKRERPFLRMAGVSLFFAAATLALFWFAPAARAAALPFCALWILSPLLISWLNTPVENVSTNTLSDADKRMLRQVARQTWRFFNDFVGPQTNWLPPDNYQADLRVEVAQRTSPTNIGLGLLSTLVAHDFGYVTLDGMIERTEATLQTLEKMEQFEGHLLNWYDIRTLAPLPPQYISMVDTGNLLGALWALAQGIDELLSAPILSASALRGLQDTLGLLRPLPVTEGMAGDTVEKQLSELEALAGRPAEGMKEIIHRIRAAKTPSRGLVKAVNDRYPDHRASHYWAQQVEQQVTAEIVAIGRYLGWVEVLDSLPEGGLLAAGPDVHEWRRQALASMPSLRTLATGNVAGLRELVGLQRRSEELNLPPATRSWLETLEKAASLAQYLAGERLAEAEGICARLHRLADGTNMRFLYDPTRRLFFTGYNVSDRRMDTGYYNLLASEARLGSFVSIARGEVPVEHWWALGRPYGVSHGEQVLLSWGGTMFEYLMPLILNRSFENSMLDHACKAAVNCQIAYGRQRNIPWGISESSFSAVDAQRIYQYRAFGVPGLGLKRGLEEDLVVAPYASALALAVSPVAAAKNLRRLSRLPHNEMRDGYGYYEAIDYTRQQSPTGRRGVIVYSYMAHHQGMILGAIDNALHDNILQERFHRDPRVRATESLLYERIPMAPAIVKKSEEQEALPRLPTMVAPPRKGSIDTPNTSTPQTNLLSNGAYSVMLTNAGGGYSQWQDVEITRWRADTTCDAYGAFCYLKDLDTGAVWSATHQPVHAMPQHYHVNFTPDKSEIRRRDDDIETLTEIVVSPEDNVEVRRITLVNHSRRTRRIELTSYAEIALAPHNSDRAHPAFSKLFVETEALPEQGALLAWRRPRSATDSPLWALHVAAADFETSFQYETDRARFLGRGRTVSNPEAMERSLSDTAGAVLDPVFSLRRHVTLEAGQRVQIAFVTGAASSRQDAVALVEKYRVLQAASRAIEMAWTHAQLELRHLRIHQNETQAFQQLASYILYPTALLRPSPERLARNTLGQSRLWAHGISGDLPIVVVTIGDVQDIGLVRQVLLAHAYWQARGLKVDILLLNEEAVSYDQPLQQQLRKLVEAYASPTGMERPGGVFLRPIGQIQEEERTLLLTAARVVLIAARGGLADQLGTPNQSASLPPALVKRARIKEEPSAPLPFMELPFFNGLGGFTQDGKEYVVYLGPDSWTPMPWVNVMANPSFGALVSESGAGFSWYGNSQSNRLTPWSNDPISDPSGDALYIRDEDTGVFWTPTAHPIREQDAYRIHHGQGYTLFEHNSHAIEQELTIFVPMDEDGGSPLRLQRLRLTNRSSRRRRLTVTFYCEWVLGAEREETQMHVRTQWDAASHCLLARNPYHPDLGGRVAFVASNLPVVSFTGDRTEFLGRNGALSAPAALKRTRLSGRVGAGLDPCAVVQVAVELDPHEQTEIVFLLGQAAGTEEARALIQRYRNPEAFDHAFKTTCRWWDDLLYTVQVETPDLAVNFLMNRWLLYQDLSCRLWGRSAFYQSGGAYGFRDQLQDVMALVYAAPHIAREQIVRTAARQFVQGDVQHWWHPSSGAGVRTRISDDLLWLPYVTAHYVRVTGDAGILDESIPFLEGKILEADEHEAYYCPAVSHEHASLLEHCRRAVAKGLTTGSRGLPLIGTGDWNDGLNRVGIEGKGESVWLAWFLVSVMNDFAGLLKLRAEEEEAGVWQERAKKLAETVEEQAWDGEWYRRAYFDDGTPLGSKQSEEAQIDSLAQSWSVISGAANTVRAAMAMRAVEEHLVRKEDKMVLLFTPPFDRSPQDPGYIKGYPPGVRENGGQYTHGSLWVPLAFARQGEGDRAVALLRMMNPVEHARVPEDVQRYKTEPYVVAADIYALEGRVGRGGWTWYTGSAAWMYRVWLEEVFGFHLRRDKLTLNPCIAAEWSGLTLRYRYRSTWYEIVIENPHNVCRGVEAVEIDGEAIAEQTIDLKDDGVPHTVRVRLGTG
jgi:cyclic beta-1,2-glucan synthetase